MCFAGFIYNQYMNIQEMLETIFFCILQQSYEPPPMQSRPRLDQVCSTILID